MTLKHELGVAASVVTIQPAGSELWIVRQLNRPISESLADFEDAVNTTDYRLLKVDS